jgi:hypothetical protein
LPPQIAFLSAAKIDDFHLKSSIPVKIRQLKSSGEAVEKALEMNFEKFWGAFYPS